MGLADRLPDAARPTNRIAAVRAPEPPSPPDLHHASPTANSGPAQAAPQGRGGPSSAAEKKPAYLSEPEAIARAFYIEDKGGERRYYDDYRRQRLAMRATESTISTKREDRATIAAMLALASARGWTAVDIKGTAEFRREAWIEAQVRGLDARGHTASDLDRQEADRRRAERGPPNEVRVVAGVPSAPLGKAEPAPARALAAPDAKAAAAGKEDEPPRAAVGPDKPSPEDSRKALRAARKELSADGRLVLAALSEKIERQMNRINAEAKAELKLFVASELVSKERAEGPVVLSAAQKRAAAAPEPARTAPSQAAPSRRSEPDPPRRSRSR